MKIEIQSKDYLHEQELFSENLSAVAVKPPTSGGGYKAIECDEFCYKHCTIFNVLHSTVKLRLNCEYAVT